MSPETTENKNPKKKHFPQSTSCTSHFRSLEQGISQLSELEDFTGARDYVEAPDGLTREPPGKVMGKQSKQLMVFFGMVFTATTIKAFYTDDTALNGFEQTRIKQIWRCFAFAAPVFTTRCGLSAWFPSRNTPWFAPVWSHGGLGTVLR